MRKKKKEISTSKPFLHPPRHRPQIPIDFTRRRPQYQADNRLPRDMNVLESAQDMYLAVRQHDPRPARILNREAGLAVVARDPADRAREVLAVQRLHVADLKGLDVEIVEPEEGDGVVDVEAEAYRAEEVVALLEGFGGGVVGCCSSSS